MSGLLTQLQKTTTTPYMIVLRLAAGVPLVFLGAKHFIDPGHFRSILEATQTPMIDVNAIAAPIAEVLAGVLLLTGFFARIGGLLGAATMFPAILATLKLMGLPEPKPFVPPLPVPVGVLLCSLLVLWKGGGAWSVDAAQTRKD